MEEKLQAQNASGSLGNHSDCPGCFGASTIGGIRLKQKNFAYQEREEALQEAIEDERKRAEDIEELEAYTKTKKYVEDVAKEKLGLVYEDEIIFKSKD